MFHALSMFNAMIKIDVAFVNVECVSLSLGTMTIDKDADKTMSSFSFCL
jgi:hypothetical protein